jgi:phage shock protein PspC (stress-responsive transcriptional regulator)
MKDKQLYRNENNSILGGVCSGIADYFEFKHVILVRLLFIMLFISPSIPSILIYLILWITIKEKK